LLQAFEESIDWAVLSSLCDDSNLRYSLHKDDRVQLISTFFEIGNHFHVTLRILSLQIFKQCLRLKSWKAKAKAEKAKKSSLKW